MDGWRDYVLIKIYLIKLFSYRRFVVVVFWHSLHLFMTLLNASAVVVCIALPFLVKYSSSMFVPRMYRLIHPSLYCKIFFTAAQSWRETESVSVGYVRRTSHVHLYAIHFPGMWSGIRSASLQAMGCRVGVVISSFYHIGPCLQHKLNVLRHTKPNLSACLYSFCCKYWIVKIIARQPSFMTSES